MRWQQPRRNRSSRARPPPRAGRSLSLADKLNNLRAIVRDYGEIGEALWARFNPDADQIRIPPFRRPPPDHTGGPETHYHPDQQTGHRVAPSRDREWLHHLTAGDLIAWRSTSGSPRL